MSDTPKSAVEAEAEGATTVSVEWRDLSFDVPLYRLDWPLDAELALREGDPVGFVQAMIGERFDEVRALQPTLRDVDDLGDRMIQALGFKDAGESPASSD